MTMRLQRRDLEQLDKVALALLSEQKAEEIERARHDRNQLDRDIQDNAVSFADHSLLAAGLVGVGAGVTIATGGLAAAAAGAGLLVLGLFGVIGGADQMHDKLVRGRDLRRRREEVQRRYAELIEEGRLIDLVYRSKP